GPGDGLGGGHRQLYGGWSRIVPVVGAHWGWSTSTITVWPTWAPFFTWIYEPSVRPVVTGTSVILPLCRSMTRTTSAPVPFCLTAATGTVRASSTFWSTTVIET